MNEQEIENRLSLEELELASINQRAFAYFIDELIVTGLFVAILWGQIDLSQKPEQIMLYTQQFFPYVVVLKVLYQTIFVYMYGATLGKLALKIRVIEYNYMGLPTLKEAILRAVVRIFSEMLFYFGFLVAFFSPLRMTWHDRVSSTLVVNA